MNIWTSRERVALGLMRDSLKDARNAFEQTSDIHYWHIVEALEKSIDDAVQTRLRQHNLI